MDNDSSTESMEAIINTESNNNTGWKETKQYLINSESFEYDTNISDNDMNTTQLTKNSKPDLIVPPWDLIYFNHSWDINKLSSIYKINSTQLQEMCHVTYWNALKTTIYYSYIDNTTFVITGDIEDMWIRDSTEQIWPYFALINKYNYIKYMIRGVILKQSQFILADVYANAFRKEPYCYDETLEILIKTSIIATRDNEIDSGGAFIKLLYEYYYHTKDIDIFFEHDNIVKSAVIELLKMWQTEQHHDSLSEYKSVTHGIKLNLPNTSYTGMIWTSHRPSDDLCIYPYHIADNFFIYQILEFVIYFADKIWNNTTMSDIAIKLQYDIYDGIHKFGVINYYQHDEQKEFGDIYCYEVDGNGNCNLMDDANIPSLLSIPMISNKFNKTIYENTRKWLLSEHNPYYFISSKNNMIKGIGSPHTPKGFIWPLALITQGFTSQHEKEKYKLLKVLIENTGGTGLMHESFKVENDEKFTRKFFSWANSYFSVYANCAKQFIDLNSKNVRDIIEEKQRTDKFIGSLSSIKEVTGNNVQATNPRFVQWMKICEPVGRNKYIDEARITYDRDVFNRAFLGKKTFEGIGK